MASCSSAAQETAFTALANSTSTPSPMTLTIRPTMCGDQWLKDLCAPGLQGSQRAGLIRLHQAAVPNNVGGKDSR
jgi:hypothetical protein